jgi:hypothetical protein
LQPVPSAQKHHSPVPSSSEASPSQYRENPNGVPLQIWMLLRVLVRMFERSFYPRLLLVVTDLRRSMKHFMFIYTHDGNNDGWIYDCHHMISTLIVRVAIWSMAGSIRGHTLAPFDSTSIPVPETPICQLRVGQISVWYTPVLWRHDWCHFLAF